MSARAQRRLAVDASLKIDSLEYVLDDAMDMRPMIGSGVEARRPSVRRQSVITQPADGGKEIERRIINLARGWGESKFNAPGGYDYAASANLHRRLSWLPGSTVTDRTHAIVPIGEVSFCEYWDGTAANRRLLIVTPRRIYEVDTTGAQTVGYDGGAGFTRANGMTKGVCFRAGGMTAPKVFFARNGSTATDYMVRRTDTVPTYLLGTANTKFAMALAKGKDAAGADVLWRVNENGKMNQSVADADPNLDASWSGASYPNSLYPLGDTSTRVNDLTQQNRAMVAGKPDGAWSFDNVLNTIPITPGMAQTPDDRSFDFFEDFNGTSISPTVQGLVAIDGLTWNIVGPVSANQDARQLRGREVAVSSVAGNYIFAADYYGSVSYIFMGTPRQQGENGNPNSPITWHGPVASIAKKVTHLRVSTVFGTKLWIGYCDTAATPTTGGWATIELNTDFSPVSDLSTGYIYLPDGILDMSGPGIIKDLRKAEFIAPADVSFSATNQWTVEVDVGGTGSSYVAIDGGNVASGVVTERYWSTQTSGKRPRVRLKYAGNTGTAELEAVVLRMTERPETTDEYVFRVVCSDSSPARLGKQVARAGVTDLAALRAKVDSGWVTVQVYGEAAFSARVVDVSEAARRLGTNNAPEWVSEIRVRRVKVA